jgi:mono/diheme cytochrome c family protein
MQHRIANVSARVRSAVITTLAVSAGVLALVGACTQTTGVSADDPALIARGKDIFRFDTFGDETFWTDTLRMHEVIRSAVDPTTALSVGLKVDTDSLPAAVVAGIQNGSISLTSPATTVALLKLNAVVGVKGTVTTVNGSDVLTRVGITCALCHSTVDNSFAPGIGKRLDGWPNHDLNPGAIIALSSALTPAQKTVYNSWGKGKYDARYNFDGLNGPSVIPPAYGLKGVTSVTYTGDGADLAYWNRYVAVTQMHGHGSWVEARATPPENVQNPPDMVSDKLAALQAYQLSIQSPPAPAGSFDAAAAARGRVVFEGAGKCASCHMVGSHFTDAPGKLHSPTEVVSEPEPAGPSFASRSATKMYRTTPLRALWQHAPYFHNGVATTLEGVVDLYNTRKTLNLTGQQKADLVQYLKSL